MKLLTTDQVEIMLEHIVFLTRMAEAATSRGFAAKDELAKIRNYASNTISNLDKHSIADMNELFPSKGIA